MNRAIAGEAAFAKHQGFEVGAAAIEIIERLPTDRGLRKLCRALIETPSLGFDIDEWANTIGVSRSTLTRNFRAQTGLSFAEWRRRLRLLYALTQQAEGIPPHAAAKLAGYRSVNALREMMRRAVRTDGTLVKPS